MANKVETITKNSTPDGYGEDRNTGDGLVVVPVRTKTRALVVAREERPFHEHTQTAASKIWTIKHLLGKNPAVSVADDEGRPIGGSVTYPTDREVVQIEFNSSRTGKAFLN